MAFVKEYEHALRVYRALESEAKTEEMNGAKILAYRGHITHLYASLEISYAYYSSIFRKLKSLGCITQLQRGDRGSGTGYALHFAPERAAYSELDEKPLTRPVDVAILGQRLEDLRGLIGGVDVGELLVKVMELEERLQRVEERSQNGKSKNPRKEGK